MRTKHLCVLIHTIIEVEIGTVTVTVKLKYSYRQFQGGASFVDHFCYSYVFIMLSVPCSLAITYLERAGLLAPFCVMFSLSFCLFSIWWSTWLYHYLIFSFFFTLRNCDKYIIPYTDPLLYQCMNIFSQVCLTQWRLLSTLITCIQNRPGFRILTKPDKRMCSILTLLGYF